jgi:hypothetical protein
MLVIIDCRDGESRRDALTQLCQEKDTDVRLFLKVWGDVEVENEQIWPQFEALIGGAALVLLHCGPDQLYAADALRREVMAAKNCLAFFGGASPHVDVKRYFSERPSETHALVPERLALTLKADSDDAEKFGKCLDLILTDERRPREAVEQVYGDLDLDRILEGLYGKLQLGPNNVDLGAIRKERDLLIEAHYEKARGWKNPAVEQGP